jgi:hypothetical protein
MNTSQLNSISWVARGEFVALVSFDDELGRQYFSQSSPLSGCSLTYCKRANYAGCQSGF